MTGLERVGERTEGEEGRGGKGRGGEQDKIAQMRYVLRPSSLLIQAAQR